MFIINFYSIKFACVYYVKLHSNEFFLFSFRINPLSLVEIVAYVITQFSDPKEAVEFLEKTEGKVKANNHAVTLCKVLKGDILLQKLHDQPGTKVLFYVLFF